MGTAGRGADHDAGAGFHHHHASILPMFPIPHSKSCAALGGFFFFSGWRHHHHGSATSGRRLGSHSSEDDAQVVRPWARRKPGRRPQDALGDLTGSRGRTK